jgi:F0F1-type ATP synthase gamma subunit
MVLKLEMRLVEWKGVKKVVSMVGKLDLLWVEYWDGEMVAMMVAMKVAMKAARMVAMRVAKMAVMKAARKAAWLVLK